MSYEARLRECGVKKLEISVDLDEKLPFSVRECIAWDGEEDTPVYFLQRYPSLEQLLQEFTQPLFFPLGYMDELSAPSKQPEGKEE